MSVTDHENEDYEKLDYWERRYKVEDNFEWCCNTDGFASLLEGLISTDSRILVLGCGNSSMSADLYALGHKRITNIDYSATVIAKMENKYRELTGMSWKARDMLNLEFPKDSFDCVIEKATFEVLFVGEKDVWNVSPETTEKFRTTMQQINNVLIPGGRLLSISFTQPHFRLPLLRTCCPDWSFQHKTFGDFFHYFFYIGTKPDLPDS